MDYLGNPHLRNSYLGVYSIHIDMANRCAAIPGSGDDVTSFAYSYDIARFVEAALDLPQWKKQMSSYSENKTLNEVVEIAEKVACTVSGSFLSFVADSMESRTEVQRRS
jgi:hypothetical protein